MAKQVFTLKSFEGGINNKDDDRDIEDNEFVHVGGFNLKNLGRITTEGGTETYYLQGSTSAQGVDDLPAGSGVYSFSSDYDNLETAADPSDGVALTATAGGLSTNYTLLFDEAASHPEVTIHEENDGGDGVTAQLRIGSAAFDPFVYAVPGSWRVIDRNMSDSNSPMYIGYESVTLPLSLRPSIDTWVVENVSTLFTEPSTTATSTTYHTLFGLQAPNTDSGVVTANGGSNGAEKISILNAAIPSDFEGYLHPNIDSGFVIEVINASRGMNNGNGPPGTWDCGTNLTNDDVNKTNRLRFHACYVYSDGQQTPLVELTGETKVGGKRSGRGSEEITGRSFALGIRMAWSPFGATGAYKLSPRIRGVRIYWDRVPDDTKDKFLLAEADIEKGTRISVHSEWTPWRTDTFNLTCTLTTDTTLNTPDHDGTVKVGMGVSSSTGTPSNSYVTAVSSDTVVTLNAASTNTATEAVTFGHATGHTLFQDVGNDSLWENSIIPHPPRLETYSALSGHSHGDIVNCKYKTAVTIGSYTFVGNIVQNGVRMNDRVLRSAENFWDIFPETNNIDFNEEDGDSIEHLDQYKGALIIFKKNSTLILSNPTSDPNPIEELRHGITHFNQVVHTEDAICWINKYGLFAFNGEQVINLLEKNDKKRLDMRSGSASAINVPNWKTFIEPTNGTDPTAMLGYIPKENKLIITKSYNATSAAKPHKITVGCVADSSDSLDGKYFDIDTHGGEKTLIWFDTDNSGTSAPSGTGSYDDTIEVTQVGTNDSAERVAVALASAINEDAGAHSTAEVDGSSVVITDAASQAITTANIGAGDSGFTVSTTQTGASSGTDTNNTDSIIFDMDVGSFVYYPKAFGSTPDAKSLANFTIDRNQDLVLAHNGGANTYNFLKWNGQPTDQAVDDNNYILTKAFDFGDPGVKKRIYNVKITFKSTDGAASPSYGHSNMIVTYGTNGGAVSSTFNDSKSTNYTAAAGLNGSGTNWIQAILKPASAIKDVYTFQLKLKHDDVLPAGFEINDISIVYRTEKAK